MSARVEYVTQSDGDAEFEGEGWYVVDHVGICEGPFATEEDAAEALLTYLDPD